MTFREKLDKEIVLLDGGMGTYLQRLGLRPGHFREHPGCMDYLSVSAAELVSRAHRDYIKAGCDAVETNSFGANRIKLSEYGLEGKARELNRVSAELARACAGEAGGPNRTIYVVGSMGPTGKLPSSNDPDLGDIGYSELKDVYREQAEGLLDGGVDAVLIETGQDLLEMKAAVNAARTAAGKRNGDVPVMAQCTLANAGRMLLGQDIYAVMTVMGYLGADVIGINCGTGPLEMEDALRVLSERSPSRISVVPNAGLPVEKNGKTVYPMGAEEMADIIERFIREYGLDVTGGCCGTGPEHIKSIRQRIGSRAVKRARPQNTGFAGFYTGKDIREATRPIKVGERINTLGSRRMKKMLIDRDLDGIVRLGRDQESAGADIIDICATLTERETEKDDAGLIVKRLGETVDLPLMIDSTDAGVIKGALERYPGTMFINSVNLEDGGGRSGEVFALAAEHGAFVVNLVIDEKGMARTPERKIEIAERLYHKAVDEYGIQPHRMIFDMLTFTLGTGEEEYSHSALDTIRAIELFKKEHPDALTVLGVSNVSFGLKKEARKDLNMVFLHHALKAGLDMAIVNPSEYTEYGDIPRERRERADALVRGGGSAALERFMEAFGKELPGEKKATGPEEDLSPEQLLRRCVLTRDKSGIIGAVDRAMAVHPPEEIINGILMDTMKEVGDRLDSGEMVLPHVLQAAETMREAVEYLAGAIPGAVSKDRGRVVLATVFGDVHDIGKNLVRMILANNGFEVIDLGKQVPVDRIVREAERVDALAVGLSALLVSTARHMGTCVKALHEKGLRCPVLIGGAPVNGGFAARISLLEDGSVYKGGVFYARDAFSGLGILRELSDPEKRKNAMREYREKALRASEEVASAPSSGQGALTGYRTKPRKIPRPPFFGVRPLNNIPADRVFDLLDTRALFNVSWAGGVSDPDEKRGMERNEFLPLLEELEREAIRSNWLDLKAVYGYFRCRAEGEDLVLFNDDGKEFERFHFPRSGDKKGLSLADHFDENGDLAAFQVVTTGERLAGVVEELMERGQETRAFYVHGFGVNLAEALASYVHGIIRAEIGIGPDRGARYSPGYPLWRDMRDQKKIFRLLDVERYTGIKLTPGYQMVPEQSTSALIVLNDDVLRRYESGGGQ